MKKTVSNRVFLRMSVQADEADIYGHSTIASNLTSQILKCAANVRSEEEDVNYEYSKDELVDEVKEYLWDCATRIFNYYDETPDAKDIQSIIDFESESFISYVESLISKDIGAHEPKVVGEEREDDFIEEEKEFSLPDYIVEDGDGEDEDEDEDEDKEEE